MINSDNKLLIANDKLTETNEKFAAVNKELAAVNKELAQVNEQIKQYQEKQKEFINIISHELKMPIQAIIGYIELFLNNLKKIWIWGTYNKKCRKASKDNIGYTRYVKDW